MTEKQVYTLIIRIVGLGGILYVVRHLALVTHKTGSPHFDHPLFLIYELGLIGIGYYMVAGAPGFMRLIFPIKRKYSEDEDEDKDDDKDEEEGPEDKPKN